MLRAIFVLLLAIVARTAVAAPPSHPLEPTSEFNSEQSETAWLTSMSKRLEARVQSNDDRMAILKTVRDESIRAGLNPQLVLSLIDVASGFRRYAVSADGARGLMQVGPAWDQMIGVPRDDLFHLQKNVRTGCGVLRYFLDLENGNLLKALSRYRSQMGDLVEAGAKSGVSQSDFPRTVVHMSKTRWVYDSSLR